MDDKPSTKQLEFLNSLGYKGKPPYNIKKASELIEKYVMIKSASELQEAVKYELTEDVIKQTSQNIGLYSYVLTRCVEVGITSGPVIGMLYNNTKTDIREAKKTIK